MKLAVGLFGIHYIEKLNHWSDYGMSVDYRKSLQNCKTNMFDSFLDSTVDYFSATYKSPLSQVLLNDYKFRKIQFNDIDNTPPINNEKFIRRNRIFKKTVKLMLGYDYDFALITRYDIRMMVNINTLTFDFDKINLFYKTKWGEDYNLCDDNFYFLPYNRLQKFYDDICLIDESISSHRWNQYLSDLNYLIDGIYYSHQSKIYHVTRTASKSN